MKHDVLTPENATMSDHQKDAAVSRVPQKPQPPKHHIVREGASFTLWIPRRVAAKRA